MVNVDIPLCNRVPPVEAEYQSIVEPEGALAEIVEVPDTQIEPLTAAVGIAGNVCNVTVEVAVFVHPFSSVPVTVYVVVEDGVNATPFETPLFQT